MTTRRRFLTISAAAALAFTGPARATPPLHIWRGTAMGAAATLRLSHPDAPAIAARMMAEVSRLEDILSLYRPHSALSRLNAEGRLDDPPFELLECLTLAGTAHDATEGLFDPTVQGLWQLHAEAAAAGRAVPHGDLTQALSRTGWQRVSVAGDRITLAPGTALTLNGIAQGYVADRVARLLTDEGLTDILIDMGEIRALGARPQGGAWPVHLPDGTTLPLISRALATSAPLGTVLDAAGRIGHILDPRTGRPGTVPWRSVTVSADSAALADALSTAACLMPDRATIDASLARIPGTRLESATPQAARPVTSA